MAIVFQYGSNTLPERLNSPGRLNGEAIPLGCAYTCANYDLRFEVDSKTNQCAAANIRKDGARAIWGVLYEIPDLLLSRKTAGQRKSLDQIEGAGTNYCRASIQIIRAVGSSSRLLACTYIALSPLSGLKTSLEYVCYILKGLKQFGAPADYLSYIKNVAIENNTSLEEHLERL